MQKLAIIGTAGRKEDQGILTGEHYDRMVDGAVKLIGHLNLDPREIKLYSGGAAWADHIAVTLVKRGGIAAENLTLFIPTNLEYYGYEAADQTNVNQKRTADTCNYYHKMFSSRVGINSIQELNDVRKQGAMLDNSATGFHARNAMVARSLEDDGHVLAFTTGLANYPQADWTIRSFERGVEADAAGLKDGGTAHCWNLVKSFKHHARIGVMNSHCINI